MCPLGNTHSRAPILPRPSLHLPAASAAVSETPVPGRLPAPAPPSFPTPAQPSICWTIIKNNLGTPTSLHGRQPDVLGYICIYILNKYTYIPTWLPSLFLVLFMPIAPPPESLLFRLLCPSTPSATSLSHARQLSLTSTFLIVLLGLLPITHGIQQRRLPLPLRSPANNKLPSNSPYSIHRPPSAP